MSEIVESPLVKPFAAVFSGDSTHIASGIMGLNAVLGDEPDIVSPEFPLTETIYYEKEMGADLLKVYLSWPRLIAPERLLDIKLAAMDWESRNSPSRRRRANLDPGYVFSGGLVLSTGKFRGHRLPLGRGVWGELTLGFQQGRFQPFPWSYLDYRKPDTQVWLMMMRQAYLARLKEMNK